MTPARRTSARAHASFTAIAPYYDELMARVPYDMWVDYVEDLFRRHGGVGRRVLDVATGTGAIAIRLAQRGYQVTGIDRSRAMLAEARRKSREAGVDIAWRCCDVSRLSAGDQFDLAVSLYDSLNYVTDPAALAAAFERIAEALAPGGLLIFDLNAIYALEKELFTQADTAPERPVRYRWRSHYDPETRLATIEMDFETAEGRRFREVHYQRGYTMQEIRDMLTAAGLEVAASYHAYTLLPPGAQSDRLFFVARRVER
jgi:ubiquinone/menaquinone biosynthesis C-methylase UbiE